MAGRRTSLLSLAGQKVEDVPGQDELLLLSLPLDKLIPTRFNPRRRFGTDQELTEFGHKLAKKQLQPVVVVSRAGYLKLWPEEAERVGQAPYVIANGERRYRASKLVNRPTLDVVHNEAVAASRADFLDSVQQENNERENLDPIERAIAIETMVTELGGADQVAVYYGKTKGWVSQQRKLLRLTPDLQDLVSLGEMPVRVGRDIAGLPAEHQMAAWQAELEARAAAKAVPRAERSAPAPAPVVPVLAPNPEPARFTAVNQSAPPVVATDRPVGEGPDRFTAVNQQPPEERGPDPSPEPERADPAVQAPLPQQSTEAPQPPPAPVPVAQAEEERRQVKMPWHDGMACAEIAIRKMTPPERRRLAERLIQQDLAEREQAAASATV